MRSCVDLRGFRSGSLNEVLGQGKKVTSGPLSVAGDSDHGLGRCESEELEGILLLQFESSALRLLALEDDPSIPAREARGSSSLRRRRPDSTAFVIREIVKYGSKVLRRKADAVDDVTAETKALMQDLFDTLDEAEGVGLAAPQIGVSKRVIVVDVSSQTQETLPIALINPTIVIGEGMAIAEEGCLSIPDLYGGRLSLHECRSECPRS